MYEGLIAETVTITGDGGDEIGAYLARPLGAGPFPAVIVIHHAPGWDEATKEIARKFAYHGYIAISPNLYHRFGPELAPDDAAAAARAGGWITTDQFLGDAGGALTSPARAADQQREDRHHRVLLRWAPVVPLGVRAADRCGRRLLRRLRHRCLAAGAAVPDGADHRPSVEDLVSDPRPLRHRGQEPGARTRWRRSMPS